MNRMTDSASPLTPGQHRLIGKLYEAALDDAAWRAVCVDLATAFGAASSAVVVLPAHSHKQFLGRSENFSDAMIASYEEHYWQCDVWAIRAMHTGLGRVFTSADMISDRDFERTEFYADFCRPLDVFYVIGSVFPVADGELGLLGIHRQRGQRHYTARERLQVKILLPHLQRALQIRHRLAPAATLPACSAQVLDTLGVAVVLMGAQLNVLYVNAAAIKLFGADVPALLHASTKGCPRWQLTPPLARAVRAAIGSDSQAPACQSLRVPRAEGAPLIVSVAPFRSTNGPHAGEPCALLLARDPGVCAASLLAMQHLFGLTPSETQVCQSLAQGQSVDEIANACAVSACTVKTHLHHIYGKTGARRQGELIALVHQCIAAAPGFFASSPPNG